MGIKLLKLQTIQWCFMVGNNFIQADDHHDDDDDDHRQSHQPNGTNNYNRTLVKLIKTDGIVKIYDRPIQVSDLMLEFPKHMVCSSDAFYIGQKIPALSEHDKLLPGHNYFLLPIHCFQSALSLVTVATSFSASLRPQHHDPAAQNDTNNKDNMRVALLKKAALNCRPFDIQKTSSGFLRIRITDEFISRLTVEDHREDGYNGNYEQYQHQHQHQQVSHSVWDPKSNTATSSASAVSLLCTTPELEKDYSQLVGFRRHYKPRLETISESNAGRRQQHDHQDQNNKKKLSKLRKFSSFGSNSTKKKTTKFSADQSKEI